MSQDIQLPLDIQDIIVPEGRRAVNPAAVKRLAESIDKVGLRHPITVRRKGEKYILVAGLHRMEACKKLGREHVPAIICSFTNTEARMWEIAENLHRADLSKLERDEQLAEWISLSNQLTQVVSPHQGGIRAAARELGINREEARRAVQVASISDEAKEAIRDGGLENNRSAMLSVARKPASEQVAAVRSIAADPVDDAEATEKQVAALMAAWNKAGPEARQAFRERIDAPVMDRRFG